MADRPQVTGYIEVVKLGDEYYNIHDYEARDQITEATGDITQLTTTVNNIANGTTVIPTYLKLTGGTMTGNINMNNKKVTGVPTPTADTDAVNKAYVDSAIISGGYILPMASSTALGGVKADTPPTGTLQAVYIDSTGFLKTAHKMTASYDGTNHALVLSNIA